MFYETDNIYQLHSLLAHLDYFANQTNYGGSLWNSVLPIQIFNKTSLHYTYMHGVQSGNSYCHSKKCSAMRFSLTSSVLLMAKPSNQHKDLGITTTSNLSWSEHIMQQLCATAYRSLHLIRRSLSSSCSTTEIRLHLYLTLVRSKLSYCSQLWRPGFGQRHSLFSKVQQRATKFILNDLQPATTGLD